jgi:hypothetical protein
MKLADLTALKPGTQLTATGGDRVAFNGITTITTNGRAYQAAAVILPNGGKATIKPASLQPATDPYPVITGRRDGIEGHTITVERADRVTARGYVGRVDDWEALIGARVVVERLDGRLVKVCQVEPELYGEDAEDAARACASSYGARYVPVG